MEKKKVFEEGNQKNALQRLSPGSTFPVCDTTWYAAESRSIHSDANGASPRVLLMVEGFQVRRVYWKNIGEPTPRNGGEAERDAGQSSKLRRSIGYPRRTLEPRGGWVLMC
jgi:hypothetical protein